MRILFSIHHPLTANQGAPGVTYQLAKHFAERGDKSQALSFLDMPPSRLFKWPLLQQVRFPWFVSRKLARIAPELDVADCSSGDAWVYQTLRRERRLLMVARSHGLEHLVDKMFREEAANKRQMHSWKYPIYHGGYRLWEVARSFRSADLAIFPNAADRAYAVQHLRVKLERTVVIPNGIPDDFTDQPPRQPLPASSKLRIALLGTYSHRKINVAPQALNRVLQAHPNVLLGFLGTGVPAEEVLADYAQEHHERIRVTPHYSHEALPALLAEYDVLLFPSLSEGFGLAVYEAQACGLAVIATDLEALQAYLTHEKDVLFIPRSDANAIEGALKRLLTDAKLLAHLQKQGRQSAQRFAWSKVVAETAAVYQEFIDRKRG